MMKMVVNLFQNLAEKSHTLWNKRRLFAFELEDYKTLLKKSIIKELDEKRR